MVIILLYLLRFPAIFEACFLFNDPTFYQNLSATTANAATLLEDLKAHPKRYVHFSLFGKKDK